MPYYEHVFIARQDVSSQQVDDLASQISDIVEKNDGKVTKVEPWGLRTLAYRIRKNRKGHYVLLNLDAPPGALTEIEEFERYNDDIIRWLTIRVDELDDGPSMLIKSRSRDRDDDKDDRGDKKDSGKKETKKKDGDDK